MHSRYTPPRPASVSELVHACMLEGKAPDKLNEAYGDGRNIASSQVTNVLFVRPSDTSTPTSVQPEEWWGICEGGSPSRFNTNSISKTNLSLNWCIGDRETATLNQAGTGKPCSILQYRRARAVLSPKNPIPIIPNIYSSHR